MSPLDIHDVPAQRRAGVAMDAITTARSTHARQHRRPAALTAREALEAVRFECLLLWTAWANLRAGFELTDDDHDRIGVAMARIEVICGEVAL